VQLLPKTLDSKLAQMEEEITREYEESLARDWKRGRDQEAGEFSTHAMILARAIVIAPPASPCHAEDDNVIPSSQMFLTTTRGMIVFPFAK